MRRYQCPKDVTKLSVPEAGRGEPVRIGISHGAKIFPICFALLLSFSNLTAQEPETVEWPAYGRTPGGQRHSPLADINARVYKAFNAAGIEIPYSKHDVYIKQMAKPE